MNEKEITKRVRRYLKHKGLPADEAVTFADVYVIDRTSRINKRSDIKSLSTNLTKNIKLNTPIVSANMKDVTESAMAIALAREGGLGFIHQFMPIEKRVAEVRIVKRADNEVIENPWSIRENISLKEALDFMRDHKTTGVLVVDEAEKLVGILTSRDVWFLKYESEEYLKTIPVSGAMTKMPLITGAPDIKIGDAITLLAKNKVEKLPLVDSSGRPAGLITAKDVIKKYQYPLATRDKKGRLLVGASVGLSENYLKSLESLLEAEADTVLLDTARANALTVKAAVENIKKHFPKTQLVVGNVDNIEGSLLLIDAGADAVKVGIGPGSACKTQVETGVGAPQLTAIAECAAVADDIPIIADGGIDEGEKLAKALVAGASAVMLGGYLAGTKETPGPVFADKGRQFKIYRGSASLDFQLERMEEGSLDHIRAPEGEPRRVDYKGEVGPLVESLMNKLRSAMSYMDAFTIEELHQKKFRRRSRAGYEEGLPKG